MKYLIITGASGNLGRELIKSFDFKSYDYVFLVGKEDLLKSFSLDENKFKIIGGLDLALSDDVQKLFDSFEVKKEDELFILHLVGKYKGGEFLWEYTKEDLMTLLIANLSTSFLVSKFAMKKVMSMKGGSIVFVSSRLTVEYESKRSVYALSKQALNFLVRIIEKEGREINFTANAIAPSIILTETNMSWIDAEKYPDYITPERIGQIVSFIFQNYDKFNGNVILLNDKI